MKNIEVELRGPLDTTHYERLLEYMKKNGTLVSTQKRLFFDLSQTIGINNRTLDVRAKVTNDHIQIVVKKSDPGSVSREEAEVSVVADNLREALHVLALLGYPKGVYGERSISRYTVGDIEFAIQDVISLSDKTLHSRFYEAEILATAGEEQQAEENLRQALARLGLPIHDTESWNTYEKQINADANGWFDFSSTDISGFLAK